MAQHLVTPRYLLLQHIQCEDCMINSLAPGRPRCHFKTAIFNFVLLIGIFTSSKDNALRWMPWDLTNDKSTLVQVMAWCRQATSHYLSQCWPSSTSPYGVTRPQWVNSHSKCIDIFQLSIWLEIWFFITFPWWYNTHIYKCSNFSDSESLCHDNGHIYQRETWLNWCIFSYHQWEWQYLSMKTVMVHRKMCHCLDMKDQGAQMIYPTKSTVFKL